MYMQNYLNQINKAADLLKEADYVLVGAGAGLSAAGGLNYHDSNLFNEWFPKLSMFGINTISEAISLYWNANDSNRQHFWAYWANHIKKIRYEAPALKPYLDLFELIREKNYFIITTNVDDQFIKAGFDKNKIFAPQGDYGLFQCERPCSNELYPNQELINQMITHMDVEKFAIRKEDIPHCPKCGSYMTRNIRIDHTFVEAPHIENQKDYIQFINHSVDGNLVLLELGVGFNTPVIIRWPFEKIASSHPNSTLIRINMDSSEVPEEIYLNSLSFNTDIIEIINAIKAQVCQRL